LGAVALNLLLTSECLAKKRLNKPKLSIKHPNIQRKNKLKIINQPRFFAKHLLAVRFFKNKKKMDSIQKLKNEMRLYIDENQFLHEELKKHPIKVEVSCDLVSYDNHKENEFIISKLISEGQEFHVNARKGDGVLTLRPFKYDTDGLFFGLVVGVNGKTDIKVYEIVIFGTYDLYQFEDKMYYNYSLS
jgi:hypothetical protein